MFASPQNNLGSTTQNAKGKSKSYGAEVSFQAVLDDFRADFGGAWNSTTLGTFSDIVIPADLLRYIPRAVAGDTVDLTGKTSPYSPKITYNVGVDYTFHLADGMSLRPRLDFAHIGEQKDGLYDLPVLLLEERNLLNASVNVEYQNWYATAYSTNLTDQNYIAGKQELGQLNCLGAPRQYGIRIGAKF